MRSYPIRSLRPGKIACQNGYHWGQWLEISKQTGWGGVLKMASVFRADRLPHQDMLAQMVTTALDNNPNGLLSSRVS